MRLQLIGTLARLTIFVKILNDLENFLLGFLVES